MPRTRSSTTTAATTSDVPRPTRTALTGSAATNTNPVRTVPAIAPTVPVPDRRPTTVPVSARSVSRTLVTIGGTADRRAPGTRIASIAVSMAALAPAASPAPRTTKGVAATTTPETASRGPRDRSGGDASAALPPAQAPVAMAASATPMTRVLVSRVRPR